MLYLCGADLESQNGAASANIQEILSVSMNENINFLIETGGATAWSTEGIDPDKLQRWLVSDGTLELCDEQDSANMGGSSTLTDFITWDQENYSADKYMLTFWNHGGEQLQEPALTSFMKMTPLAYLSWLRVYRRRVSALR